MPEKNSRASLAPLLMVGVGIILMVVSLFWFIGATQDTFAQPVSTVSVASSSGIPYPEVQRLRVEDAKAAFDSKKAIFLDTRGEPYFSQGHIPGALAMTDDEIPARLGELDPNTWIITYCT